MRSSVPRVETSTHDTDLRGPVSLVRVEAWEEEDFVLRLPLDNRRHSRPSDEVRLGDDVSTWALSSFPIRTDPLSSSGSDNRVAGFGLIEARDRRGERRGLVFNGSLDKKGVSALEKWGPASLLDRSIPGLTIGGSSSSMSRFCGSAGR
jgi:hypothetical protein